MTDELLKIASEMEDRTCTPLISALGPIQERELYAFAARIRACVQPEQVAFVEACRAYFDTHRNDFKAFGAPEWLAAVAAYRAMLAAQEKGEVMSDNQEAYDAKCPALEAHEADREPTVEERGWEREGRRLDPSEESPLPADSPIMVAWEEYRDSSDFANSRKWAQTQEHVDGALWAAFLAGWQSALSVRP